MSRSLCLLVARSALLFPVLLTLPLANARVLHVRPAGSSADAYWPDAYTDLPQAISSAQAGDEVWVAAGVYPTRITLREGVALYGGFTGTETERAERDWRRHLSVLDGEYSGAVVTVGVVTPATVLDGFVVRNGFGPTISNYPSGGGVRSVWGSPTIRNNVFTRNYALNGGALYFSGGKPIVENNRIIGNHADNGAGIYLTSSQGATIRNNVIQGNSGFWGGLYGVKSSPLVIGNTFTSNHGAAINLSGTGAPVIVNNLIAHNQAGVTLAMEQTSSVFRNNAVYGNLVSSYHGPEWEQWEANNLIADPRLVSVAGGDVRLLPGSPLVDAGDSSLAGLGAWDMDGQPRVQGSGVDIGADESDAEAHVWTPRVLRVRPDGNDARDGLSWETARRTIQSAMDDAVLNGGEVWVATGVFAENVVRGPYVNLYGGFAGTETERSQRDAKAHPTHIDAGRKGSALRMFSGVVPVVVDGFTLRNGTGTTWYGGSQRNGGGLFARNTSAIITNNVIRDNTASVYGGGLFVAGPNIVVEGNTIIGNTLTTPSLDSVGGGGIHADGPNIVIRDNDISGNSAGNGGGMLLVWRGPITVERNRITNNHATSSGFGGGGITVHQAPVTLDANTISGNTAVGDGGGIRCVGSTTSKVSVTNNIFARNSAANGGAVYLGAGTHMVLTNNTVVENLASGDGGGLSLAYGTVTNSIVAFNSSGIAGGASVTSSDVYGNTAYDYKTITDPTGQRGNMKTDPLFVDATAGDYRLAANSPLIDAGWDVQAIISPLDFAGHHRWMGQGIDIGAYEFVVEGAFTMDDVRRALALSAGLAPIDAEDARLNLHTPEVPGIEMGDVLRIARKAMGWESNP